MKANASFPEAGPESFWPQALRTNGYHTAMIGKWHVGKEAGFGRAWDHQRVWTPAQIYPERARLL